MFFTLATVLNGCSFLNPPKVQGYYNSGSIGYWFAAYLLPPFLWKPTLDACSWKGEGLPNDIISSRCGEFYFDKEHQTNDYKLTVALTTLPSASTSR